ncbi:NAD(+) diphosphatase [Humidisolicoccus flavus]|uniref:NAD(+) diphosphatase n=1 Tax=Humidisolicoccus flavus TaxID=3111414 RepID=UPI00324E0413
MFPTFSRPGINRFAEARADADVIAKAMEDPRTRILMIREEHAPVRGASLVWVSPSAVPQDAQLSLLGRTDLAPEQRALADSGTSASISADPSGASGDANLLLLAEVAAHTEAPEGSEWQTLRVIGSLLHAEDSSAFVAGLALSQWHQANRFSPHDGSMTSLTQAGWVQRDETGREIFPRMDPAVIVAVHNADDSKILLGRNAAWPDDRFSLFAGFVELGESLEATVAREVFEESGIAADRVQYVASQPWPFPRSIMIAFECVAANEDDARADGEEIVEVRWFTRSELLAGDGFALPGPTSIARFVIERWIARGADAEGRDDEGQPE